MGCFGKCGCAECCLSEEDMADIASSVRISHPRYASTVTFNHSDCCNTATAWDGLYPEIHHCFVTNDMRANESITVRARFIRSQVYVPDTPIETCLPTDFVEPPEYGEVCGDTGNCAVTVKNYAEIEKIAAFIRYSYGRTRVSVIKRNIYCYGSSDVQCKFVVECAVEVVYSMGGMRKKSVTKNSTSSGGDGCCHSSSGWTILPGEQSDNPAGSDCFWNQTEEEPSFICYLDGPDVAYGATQTAWLRKYRIYDTADDIPSSITFDSDTTSDCVYEPCQDGEDSLCFAISGDVYDPIPGGNLVTVVSQSSCGYCIQTEPLCFSSECTPLQDNFCSCDPDFVDRHNHVQGIATGFDSFAYVNNPYAVSNGVCFYPRLVDYTATTNYPSCDGCNIAPNFYFGQGVPPEERTSCNWFDCMNCISGDDPWLARLQPQPNTVDAYSFSSTADEYSEAYCIPFPTITITLNP